MGGTGRTPTRKRGLTRTHIITFNNNAAAAECYYILYRHYYYSYIYVRALCSAGVCICAHAPGLIASGRGIKNTRYVYAYTTTAQCCERATLLLWRRRLYVVLLYFFIRRARSIHYFTVSRPYVVVVTIHNSEAGLL